MQRGHGKLEMMTDSVGCMTHCNKQKRFGFGWNVNEGASTTHALNI